MDIFSDKSSLVLRHLLQHPNQEWVVRDLSQQLNISRGLVANVLSSLRKIGFLKGKSRGRYASASLRNAQALIEAWTHAYDFNKNAIHPYYSSDFSILNQIKNFFLKSGETYALTLHTGANLITRFVRNSNVYIYLTANDFAKQCADLRRNLNLLELKQGGNIFFIQPYYKNSVFYHLKTIKKYSVVSSLQLYLDLFHFPERGKEHATYFLRTLKEKGETLD